ncbi:MAG TPA: alpha-glucosidase, partial [Spirochaetales bacterium]|nr:alpha-glucosidase [Spirochaetales bacterium]
GAYNRVVVNLEALPDEYVYGCGEQYSYFNLRGKKVPIWVQEQGVGRGFNAMKYAADIAAHGAGGNKFTTYYAMPVFISSRHYAVIADTDAYSLFDFSHKKFTRLEFWQVPRTIKIIAKKQMTELVSAVVKNLGIQPKLPDWVFDGFILGAQGGTESVLDKLSKLEKAQAALSGLWIQDWEGKRVTSFGSQLFWNWMQNDELYPHLEKTIAELKQKGIRVLGYINTFLALEGSLYKEASLKGYCVKKKDGSDYLVTITTFPAALLDLTNPGAVSWIKEIIKKYMIGIGLSGWMADFGEYMPTDAVLYSGESPELVHNRYPALWAKVNYEAVEEAGKANEVFFFCRAGYSESQRYAPAFWAGDQLVNWYKDDGLPSIIPAALSLGLCGVGQFHADIGGYTTVGWVKRSRELLKRWTELGIFMPVMRSHEGNRPGVNAQPYLDDDLASFTARCSKIYRALQPYAIALREEYQHTGLPYIRPLFMHYPLENKNWQNGYEYLYGRDLLVAPVIQRGKKRKRVWLPDDTWVHLWTGKVYKSGLAVVDAPLGYPPVFFREGTSWRTLFEQVSKL